MTDTEQRRDSSGLAWRGVLVGAAAGLLSGLLGIGGGIVIVPSLIALLAMDRKMAHGTSLGATLPVAAASLATYAFHDNVDWPIAGCLAIGAVCGAILGTQLLQIIPKRPLTIIFVVTILATAIRLLITSDTMGRGDLSLAGAAALAAIGFVTGTLSGLLGIGGGVVMVPTMIVFFSMFPVLAKGTSVAVIVPTSLMGTIRNRSNGNTDLKVAAAVGISGVVTAVIGSTIADAIDPTVSNTMFAVLLVVVAILQIRTLFARDATPGPHAGSLPPVE